MTAAAAKRVLVVDDFADVRDMYRVFLELSGFEVLEAGDGVQAVRVASQNAPDIIVMDLSLPVMDGAEAARRIKRDARTAHIPILALTGLGDRESTERFGSHDWEEFVAKPCLPDDLVKIIERVLGISGST